MKIIKKVSQIVIVGQTVSYSSSKRTNVYIYTSTLMYFFLSQIICLQEKPNQAKVAKSGLDRPHLGQNSKYF